MIRLALVLLLFVSLAVVSATQADTSPTAAPTATEAVPTEKGSERLGERPARPRWSPRQARRRQEIGPVGAPQAVMRSTAGMSDLPV